MSRHENLASRKARGGYYTPLDISAWIARWVAASSAQGNFLEPSCGDGNMLTAMKSVDPHCRLQAFELDPFEAELARNRMDGYGGIEVLTGDFLSEADRLLSSGARFAGAIGNPPYIRYQSLDEDFQKATARIFDRFGSPFTRHVNAWVPFVMASLHLLASGGRLGMVLPSEILHVLHAAGLRDALLELCDKVVLIDPRSLWFEGTLQGAIIVMAQRRISQRGQGGVSIVPVDDREFLERDPEEVYRGALPVTGLEGRKWTHALLGRDLHELIGQARDEDRVISFGDAAQVDVGIVTGANETFLVDDAVLDRFGLHPWARPAFSRTKQIPGLIIDEQGWRQGDPTLPRHLLCFDEASRNDPRVDAYLQLREAEGVQARYKCRIRKPWFALRSIHSAPMLMPRRSHLSPRLVINTARLLHTDGFYRIVPAPDFPAPNLVAAFMSPLSALSAEIEGRSYGGGVLELVPSEIEKLDICHVGARGARTVAPERLDETYRAHGGAAFEKGFGHEALRAVGFGTNDIARIVEGWGRLSRRRRRCPRGTQLPI